MPATTRVLILDHHYAPEDWLAATGRQSKTRYRYCKLLTSADHPVFLGSRDRIISRTFFLCFHVYRMFTDNEEIGKRAA